MHTITCRVEYRMLPSGQMRNMRFGSSTWPLAACTASGKNRSGRQIRWSTWNFWYFKIRDFCSISYKIAWYTKWQMAVAELHSRAYVVWFDLMVLYEHTLYGVLTNELMASIKYYPLQNMQNKTIICSLRAISDIWVAWFCCLQFSLRDVEFSLTNGNMILV